MAEIMFPLIAAGLLALVLFAVPVATVLSVLAVVMAEATSRGRLLNAMGDIYWEQSIGFIMISVPLFILLGEIMLRSGIAGRMYNSVAQWISWLPGGLMHANIGSSALFAATSGSSVATIATIGTVAYPEIERRKYHEGIFLGSLAAGGTLGILIPPSIGLILFGVMTNTSIPELYLAGIVPGIALAMLFSVTALCLCLYRPAWSGERVRTSWRARFSSLPDLLGPAIIFGAVVGSIYGGIATPTEAASLGVCTALVLAALYGQLSLRMLLAAFERTMITTGMILLIVYAALFLNFVIGFMGVTDAMLGFMTGLGLSPVQVMFLLVAFYLVIGMFMETLSMMLLTLPIVFPVVMSLGVTGYSDVWFGIVLTLLMELALITPPIGMNLFVAQGLRTNGGPFGDVAIGTLPFLIPMLGLIVVLIFMPSVATWLPDLFYR
ncbi:TRAP transporter large permease [Salipiger sp.]|uniref:TRAP transporter large permease n=1 Tax=Salipiger sp. TaxID=2078585 RepID=UPI003A9847AD